MTFTQYATKTEPQSSLPIGTIIKICLGVFVLVVGLTLVGNLFVSANQDDIMVIQNPVTGSLTWYKNGGMHMQWFGKVTKYHKRSQFWFSAAKDQGKSEDQSIIVRFNDGGHANLSGSISWEMPLDDAHLTLIQQQYGSQDAVEQQLIRTNVEKAVYMTGPLMSSAESYAERRNDLIHLIEDQVQNGVLQTSTVESKEPDPITGEQKTVSHVQIKADTSGKFLRQEESPLVHFGIKTYNLSINNVKYDPTVEAQIQKQQEAKMLVQTAIANAKKAEQDKITVEKNGEAEAARAKWEQEVIKAKEVTAAQQRLDVANLDRQAAEQYKLTEQLKGEGEGAYARAKMQANGALEQKLDAYIKVQQAWAQAISQYQGNITPQVVTGGSSGGNNSALGLMELLQIKAAKDLALDMNIPTGGGKGK